MKEENLLNPLLGNDLFQTFNLGKKNGEHHARRFLKELKTIY